MTGLRVNGTVISLIGGAVGLLLAGATEAHDEYAEWKTPKGVSCCSDRDCFPVEYSIGPNGEECVQMPDGQCIPIPHDKAIPAAHPDGGAHICARQNFPPSWDVFCWSPGMGT